MTISKLNLSKLMKIFLVLCGVFSFLISINTEGSYAQENIDAKQIINKYFDSIGGEEKFKTVQDRTTYMSGFAMEQIIRMVSMQKAPSSLYQEIIAGNVKQKIYFDGISGTMVLGPNTIEIKGDELERLKIEASTDLLLFPYKYGISISYSGKELIDSVECQRIEFSNSSGTKWYQYFETISGLKRMQTKKIETTHGSFDQETFYSDYTDVKGIKYPFTIVQTFGMQIIELTVDSIKINTGLKNSLFKLPE